MNRRDVLTGAVTLSVSFAAGCLGGTTGGDGGDGGDETTEETTTASDDGSDSSGSGEETVTMKNTAYSPKKLSVEPGTTVVWENADSFGHDVKSAQFTDSGTSWEFQSEVVQQGGTISYTFEEAGVYEYYCTIHSKGSMCGVVIVGDASHSGTLPCAKRGGGGY